MQNKVTFVTFYTKDTIYEDIYNTHLQPSLEKFDLFYRTYPIDNLGTWFKNTINKPIIIQKALDEIDTDIVWIDADATIEKYPELLFNIPEKYDLGINWLNWYDHYGRESDRGKSEMLDGTIYLKNSVKIRKFVEEWKQRSTLCSKDHQRMLATMIKERKDIEVYKLPREYSYIAIPPRSAKPRVPLENPIIIHWQKSREGRKNLKGGDNA